MSQLVLKPRLPNTPRHTLGAASRRPGASPACTPSLSREKLFHAGLTLAALPGLIEPPAAPASSRPVLRWNLSTYGPFQFHGDPPFRPVEVLTAGEPALIVGISHADPCSLLPTPQFLAGKPYQARFETQNLSQWTPGVRHTWRGVFEAEPLQTFIWWFIPELTDGEPETWDIRFSIQIPVPQASHARIATRHSAPSCLCSTTQPAWADLSYLGGILSGVSVLAEAEKPQWQTGRAKRVLVRPARYKQLS